MTIIHVGSRGEATAKLAREGFYETAEPGVWLSSDRITKATIHPKPWMGETVQVAYQSVYGVGDDGRYGPIPYPA